LYISVTQEFCTGEIVYLECGPFNQSSLKLVVEGTSPTFPHYFTPSKASKSNLHYRNFELRYVDSETQ